MNSNNIIANINKELKHLENKKYELRAQSYTAFINKDADLYNKLNNEIEEIEAEIDYKEGFKQYQLLKLFKKGE